VFPVQLVRSCGLFQFYAVADLGTHTGYLAMTKQQLIQALKETQNLSSAEAAKVVELFFETIADTLGAGGKVEIRGLCSFCVKQYKPYLGRNPRSGKGVSVKAKKLPVFKAGTELKRRVDR
jgi:integration host factor subunit beta